MRSAIDRAIGLLARLLVRGFFQRCEITHAAQLRSRGPRVIVANHFNGFVDVVVLVAALGRLPRFVAKATLGRVVGLRLVLRVLGVVLVQRRQDGEGTAGNTDAFAACTQRLQRGDTIVIFPEGTTHDREELVELRTGAARIAMGAAAAGVDVTVVPVGLTFGDKARIRNDVLVDPGPPIRVPVVGVDDHEAVDRLTADINTALGALVPGVADPIEAWAFDRAAEIALRCAAEPEPTLARRRPTARTYARAEPELRADLLRALGDYTVALDLNRLGDREVSSTGRVLTVRAVVLAIVTWLALPFLATLAVVNATPILLVLAVDLVVSVPVSKGTTRTLIGLIAFPTSWIIAASIAVDGAWPVTGLVVAQAVGLVAALWLLHQDAALVQSTIRRHSAHVRSARMPSLAERRRAVVTAARAISDAR